MSDQFSENMRWFFEAQEGAFSVITNDEYDKSQVTFVGPEQDLAERHFGAELQKRHGNVAEITAAVGDANLYYRLFPTGEKIGLTTSYKTGKPNELRLYLRKTDFKPAPGNYWGVFIRKDEIWLCEFSERLLRQIEAGRFKEASSRNDILDDDTGDYQIVLNERPEKTETRSGGYTRNSGIARAALKDANFTCEAFANFPVFENAKTGENYVEAHHLVPMSFQDDFGVSLDFKENICCLNPLSHRMLHHAKFDIIEEPLVKLIQSRSDMLKALGLLQRDVLAMYDR